MDRALAVATAGMPAAQDVSRFNPGLGRAPFQNETLFANKIASSIQNSASAASTIADFTGQSPFKNVHAWDSGLSTLDNQSQMAITNKIMAKPFIQNWERGFLPGSSLFCALNEPGDHSKGLFTVADLPVVNYLLEIGAVERGMSQVLQSNFRQSANSLAKRYRNYIPQTPDEFANMWSYLGVLAVDNGQSIPGVGPSSSGSNTTLLGFNNWGRTKIRNTFSRHLKVGQQLFVTVRDRDMSGSRTFVDPNGQVVAGRSGVISDILQAECFTDNESVFPPNDSSVSNVGVYTNAIHNRPSKSTDLDFLRKEHQLACEYKPMEVDEATGLWYHRDLMREGRQGALAEVPDVVYESWMHGKAFKVGYVSSTSTSRMSDAQIREAHRSRAVLATAPTIAIYAGVN